MNNIDHTDKLIQFVETFVEKERRPRWKELLTKRGKSTFKNSSKLFNHLDRRYCQFAESLDFLDEDLIGLLYDFHDEPPEVMTLESAWKKAFSDAIFIIEPESLAIYFFHEGTILCTKK